jgi:hypothetical protein
MIPFLLPLVTRFPILGRLPWRLIGYTVAAGLVVWFVWAKVDAYGDRREAAGVSLEAARRDAADKKATDEHNAKVAKLDEDHNAKEIALQARVDELLARPATRTIRVPVSTACPAQVASDAGVPVEDPGDRLLEIDDPGYGVFRDWLIQYAGGAAVGR